MGATGTFADQMKIEISSVEVQHLAAVGALAGTEVTFAAARNGTGTGRLRVDADGLVRWRAPDSDTFGPGQAGVDGEYLLYDGEDCDKWVRVQIWNSYLPALPQEADVRLNDVFGGIAGDEVTAAEASAGDVLVLTVTLENVGSFPLSNVKAWVAIGAVAGFRDLLAWLWKRPQKANVGLVELSDDNVTWVRPTSEADALELASIAVGATVTLYARRTVTAGVGSCAAAANDLRLTFAGV